ncbi:hypothetical protein CDV36_010993 [Fusarium kuroshium]|uniref:Uncharacterized protein n=1 Tax=Fusarium kuroshium TaxID=2010991 RepID=A0A3M2RVU1_9HYPO|nr:hypothetical protein CDV36_010993 [Fusarium kuroshium]
MTLEEKTEIFRDHIFETYLDKDGQISQSLMPSRLSIKDPDYHVSLITHEISWTKDGKGNVKTNHTVSGTMIAVQHKSDGSVSAKFDDGYYTYNFTVAKAGTNLLLNMANPSNEHDSNAPYSLKQADFRGTSKKKASTYIL